MKPVRVYGTCILLLLGLNFTLQSQITPAGQRRFVLNADYSRFWQNDTTMYVEISTAVYPSLLVLRQDSSGYHGKVELHITIQNKSNGALVYANRFTMPINIPDSMSLAKTKSIVNNSVYTLGRGAYNVTLHSCDIFDRSQNDSSFFSLDIQNRPDTVALSDIELCSSITESSDQKDSFYKNTYRVIPNPSCVFGSTTFPLVYTYTELYNLNSKMTYAIKAQIVDSKGIVKKYRTHMRHFSLPHVVDVTTLNVSSISSGRYNYEVILSDSLNHEIIKSRRPIYLFNPNVQATQTTTISERSAEFVGLSSDELVEEFRTTKYISQSDDVTAFEKLTTAEAQREYLAKFWTRIENQEQERSGITRSIYLQRVLTANQRFKSFGKEGWRTDRGRIYCIYGEPDETERFPNSGDSKPYEIWNYHQIEGGVTFIFVDLTGFNEYTLVHSTKRGEIQDQSWEQLLK